ncbi:MAG: hypothetical protein AVDCRST_MAG14-148, partial [uncultured Rubrobacteraceae bacterium]
EPGGRGLRRGRVAVLALLRRGVWLLRQGDRFPGSPAPRCLCRSGSADVDLVV